MKIYEMLQEILARLGHIETTLNIEKAEEPAQRRNSGPRPNFEDNERMRPYIDAGWVTRDGFATKLGKQVFAAEGTAWCCRQDHGENGPAKLPLTEFWKREDGRPRTYCKACDIRETQRTYAWKKDNIIALPKQAT